MASWSTCQAFYFLAFYLYVSVCMFFTDGQLMRGSTTSYPAAYETEMLLKKKGGGE